MIGPRNRLKDVILLAAESAVPRVNGQGDKLTVRERATVLP